MSYITELLNVKFGRSRSNRKLYGEELNNYLKSKLIIFKSPNFFQK